MKSRTLRIGRVQARDDARDSPAEHSGRTFAELHLISARVIATWPVGAPPGRHRTRHTGTSALIANRTAVGTWEKFDMVDTGSGTIALYAHANHRFVTAGSSPLIADSTTAGRAQTFQLVRNSDGTASLLASANGKYVTAEDAGASALSADRTAIGPWEKFTLITT